jgi:hypothetical protein
MKIAGNSTTVVIVASLIWHGVAACQDVVVVPTVNSFIVSDQTTGRTNLSGLEFRWPRSEDVATSWTLSSREPVQSCELELTRVADMDAGNVISGFGCPDGFFSVVAWRLDGAELNFLSPTGRVMARFYKTRVGWHGERENDGAALVLTPVPSTSKGPGLSIPSPL